MSNLRDAIGLRLPYGNSKTQFQTEFEPASGTLWGFFNPKGTACFSLGLLKDIRAHDSALAVNGGHVEVDGVSSKVNYYVLGSRTPRVFNLGGDLALFVLLIKARDRDALAHYAKLCIDNLYPRIQNFYSSTLTTISLVQGDALGGGFECALASDIVVAEESAQLGLPEILFNLFPGMGAYSLLARRVGTRAAEEMILSGRVRPAKELHEMGVIDVLAKDGEGESVVREWISKNSKRRNGTQAVYKARKLVQPITREELDAITETWVDAAMRLEDRDLKMMSRIVRAQMRRMECGDVTNVTAEALAMSA
ncbi:MAG TPA: crotonase/enoyl-CoA hydratase family protein [Burkholderiales bacterium]|nr:crotonase/enoyl-CoA hydratase family protein [Burkholderiales bacterium]HYA46076.1 crotonase/enoyl-CoA hydratase family protein [Burkholderiales bacterium]